MSDLQIFNFNNKEIRTLAIEGEPYFVGKDVADILGYQNGSRDINRHVDEEDRHKAMIFDGNQYKETITINESGLYSLILGSKLPTAKKFKRWVTSEVLPAIRKHGAYMTDQKAAAIVTDKGSLADLLQQAAEQLKRKDIQIEQMKPKALFADAVSTSDTPILVGELAKILHQNGVSMGQNRMFRWLRDNGYLISKKGTSYNMPTQRAMELGLFKIKENAITHSDGHVTITKTPKVTGKGQVYFVNKFVGEEDLACRI
jgi:anti-repressor protein